MKWFMINS